ncbi:PAS domain-containing sensor histidine kinase [Geobacter sp. DSM 9736]|uniref:sensor histidine kinase n=1 Tax=Geobacter sp. DSM 9736 TaxID=1277350 RepID=UPI000B50A5A3|nr:ATP-binding protein [Geobacter sp. DSM 9736]SNB46334.1 PAS/PAC sensor signal transduction histidine kinase [Geobacter sp. DSM 9736]
MHNGNNLPSSEIRKRKREGLIIVLSLFFIIALTGTELRLSKLSSEVPMGNNIVIFGIINIIILLIILLVYLVFRNIAKLILERRQNVIGVKLRAKLVLAFVGLSLVPTMLLFFVSAGFITNSVQNWFNTQVETSLNESMEVAQTYYKSSAANALYYARQCSAMIKEQKLLNDENLPRMKALIRQKQKEYNLSVVEVFSAQREELVRASNPQLPKAEFTNPSSEDINVGLNGRELTRINPVGKADLIRGIVPIYSNWNNKDVVGVVVVNYYVPYSLVSKMREISTSYQEFRQLKILKTPITTGYILTLFLITMVIVFLAVWFGIYLAKSLTIPIQELAEATRQVAEGNLNIFLEEKGQDEIGMLVSSFNKMTEDLRSNQLVLKQSNEEVIRSNLELEQRRIYMETVLKNVTAGVISVDKNGALTTINKSAEKLLNIKTVEVMGKNFKDVLRTSHLDIAKDILRDMVLSKRDSISKQVTVPVKEGDMTLLVNVTILKDDNDEFLGTVVVFDDLTHLIKAQRMAAWREVARRIAHEIKNPLTPIQLSAQRLRKRYLGRFGEEEKVFDECTDMIIKSVDELKTLVDEFSHFARMPSAHPRPNNLNEIIKEAVSLYQQAHRTVTFQVSADEDMPLLQLDRDQIKRVIINLLDNAIAALDNDGVIEVISCYNPELRMVTCVVADNGHGIPPEDRPRLFEPYFSTKKTGTGLGLAIVNTIISDHHAFIRVKDNYPKGTRFIIEFPATEGTT